jgi:hypothetical protein
MGRFSGWVIVAEDHVGIVDQHSVDYARLAASNRAVWRAIVISSSVFITKTRARERSEEITVLPAWLRASSSSTPNHSKPEQMRSRMRQAFSPMPPQNTTASSPDRTTAIEPNSRRMRYTK